MVLARIFRPSLRTLAARPFSARSPIRWQAGFVALRFIGLPPAALRPWAILDRNLGASRYGLVAAVDCSDQFA